MKRTLLDMVQGVLNTMDSDPVNSISDTVESMQVANLIRDIYAEIVDEKNLPHNNTMFALEASTDPALPVRMRLPENISKVNWIKYDVRPTATDQRQYNLMHWMDPLDFTNYLSGRDSTDTVNYQTIYPKSGIPLVISKVSQPTFYTTFDEEYFFFDAYDSNLEATLQTSKSLCFGTERPTFTLSDTFVADLPENLFTLLYTTATNRCHAVVKQQVNPMLDRNEKRFRVRAQANRYRTDPSPSYPDYGRRGK